MHRGSILWLDTTAGVAGDMVLGALVDAGADLDFVQRCVDAVVPDSVRLERHAVLRQGQRATKLEVVVIAEDLPHRSWATIRDQLAHAQLPDRVRDLASSAFELVAQAEGKVHGVSPDDVHFHEVGALDSIADLVGSCAALVDLGIETVIGTPIAVGEGHVMVAHGQMPVPVPAVAELAIGWPTTAGIIPGLPHSHASQGNQHSHTHDHHQHDSQPDHYHSHDTHTPPKQLGELATPTGVALVRAFARNWGPQPAMITAAVGVGAGSKDTAGRPNVVRAIIGEPISGDRHPDPDVVLLAEANVDDLDPRLWPGILASLLDAGALDAWLTPIVMKKGRPAHTVHALCPPDAAQRVDDALFATTSTIGIRWHEPLTRTVLERAWADVDVHGQRIRIKVSHRSGIIAQATPEFDDVISVSSTLGMSQLQILELARVAAVQRGLTQGHLLSSITE